LFQTTNGKNFVGSVLASLQGAFATPRVAYA